MLLNVLSIILKLFGMTSWLEKLMDNHNLIEQGKTEEKLRESQQSENELKKDLSDVQKANDFESRIIADSTFCERVRRSLEQTK